MIIQCKHQWGDWTIVDLPWSRKKTNQQTDRNWTMEKQMNTPKWYDKKNTFRYLSDIFQIILAILKMYLMYHHFQNWVPSFETWPIKKMTWDPCSLFLTEWSWSATFGQTLSAFGGGLPFSDKPIQKRIEPDPKVCTPWIIWVSFSALTSPQFWKLAFFVLKQMRGF
jgi:hypothetical protein